VIWFTSDTHYDHANIIKYSKRPFADVEEMNEALVVAWNAVVRPGDTVYHLGDFGCVKDPARAGRFASRLMGDKYLVWGNHDRKLRSRREFTDHWVQCFDLHEDVFAGQRAVLCHYAMRTWNASHRGSYQLHGHSHGSLPKLPGYRQLDVGVDCWNYAPVSFDEIHRQLSTVQFAAPDRHGRDDD
jgi:calcineurin-like phosphoesterase family protein